MTLYATNFIESDSDRYLVTGLALLQKDTFVDNIGLTSVSPDRIECFLGWLGSHSLWFCDGALIGVPARLTYKIHNTTSPTSLGVDRWIRVGMLVSEDGELLWSDPSISWQTLQSQPYTISEINIPVNNLN